MLPMLKEIVKLRLALLFLDKGLLLPPIIASVCS